MSEEQATTLATFLERESQCHESSAHIRLAHALVEGFLIVGIAPPSAPAKPKGAVVMEEVSALRPISLGPHAEAGYVPPTVKPAAIAVAAKSAKPANPPPQSIEECEQRMIAARERLQKSGYQPKYTDAQLLEKAQSGTVSQERFLVSFQTKNTNPDAKLAFQRESSLSRFGRPVLIR